MVTGAARGLGEGSPRTLRDGFDVVLLDISSAVNQTMERVDHAGAEASVVALVGDVADESFSEGSVRLAVAERGGRAATGARRPPFSPLLYTGCAPPVPFSSRRDDRKAVTNGSWSRQASVRAAQSRGSRRS